MSKSFVFGTRDHDLPHAKSEPGCSRSFESAFVAKLRPAFYALISSDGHVFRCVSTVNFRSLLPKFPKSSAQPLHVRKPDLLRILPRDLRPGARRRPSISRLPRPTLCPVSVRHTRQLRPKFDRFWGPARKLRHPAHPLTRTRPRIIRVSKPAGEISGAGVPFAVIGYVRVSREDQRADLQRGSCFPLSRAVPCSSKTFRSNCGRSSRVPSSSGSPRTFSAR